MESIFTFKMPDIGEGVVEGEVINWLKEIGEHIEKDEPVVVVMTDKATVELPSPYAGKLLRQFYRVGEMAVKDHPLYEIELDAPISEEKKTQVKEREPEEKKEVIKTRERQSFTKTPAAPPVRKLAKDLNVDLEQVKGSGPEGAVTRQDLGNYLKSTKELKKEETIPLIGVRKKMAERMTQSKAIIPHFSYFDEADATHLTALREKLKEEALEKDIKLTFMPFFIKALSLTLKKYPLGNSSLEKNQIILHSAQHIGIAMTTPNGLIVPVLKDVQEMGLFDIVYAYEELKEKAKQQKFNSEDMKGSTITITNFGALSTGAVFATPIINYPESSILGVAHIQKKVVVRGDSMAIRSILNCSWSFDHRIIDGDEASKISSEFVNYIQNPAALI